MQKYNVVIIGSGSGGYVAALHLGNNHQKAAVIENKYLGGTCLNVGCIPTKTLLHSSELAAQIARSQDFGIKVDHWSVDLPAMIKRKNSVVRRLKAGVEMLLKNRRIDIFDGTGSILSANQVQVQPKDGDPQILETENIIIASGSAPIVPSIFPQDLSKIMTSDEILDLETLPKSLLIVGGGYIGCEFATVLAELGTKVTVVEMLDRLIPMADLDISAALTKIFKKMKIDVHCATPVEKMEITDTGVKTTLQGDKVLDTDLALICTGRAPCTSALNLDKIGVETEKGYIKIDPQCRTNIPNIFAIGDVTGKVQLAHVASRQAAVAAHTILGKSDAEDYTVVPSAIYTHPEIASVGLTEQQARDQSPDIKIATFSLMASGIAQAYHDTAGFVKLIAAPDDRILGAHLLSPHASDLIHEIAVLIKSECTLHELVATIHAHPTFAESLHETAEKLLGNPLHGA